MFKKISVLVVAMMIVISTVFANGTEVGVNADDAMQMLVDGNQRFVTEKYAEISIGQTRRDELTKGQHPFAIIVSCSDSRVSPELVFNEGLANYSLLGQREKLSMM